MICVVLLQYAVCCPTPICYVWSYSYMPCFVLLLYAIRTGPHTATYTVVPTAEGRIFTKYRHGHPLAHAVSNYSKVSRQHTQYYKYGCVIKATLCLSIFEYTNI
jgi:hypothetical protein